MALEPGEVQVVEDAPDLGLERLHLAPHRVGDLAVPVDVVGTDDDDVVLVRVELLHVVQVGAGGAGESPLMRGVGVVDDLQPRGRQPEGGGGEGEGGGHDQARPPEDEPGKTEERGLEKGMEHRGPGKPGSLGLRRRLVHTGGGLGRRRGSRGRGRSRHGQARRVQDQPGGPAAGAGGCRASRRRAASPCASPPRSAGSLRSWAARAARRRGVEVLLDVFGDDFPVRQHVDHAHVGDFHDHPAEK